jgi:hypothetical protein
MNEPAQVRAPGTNSRTVRLLHVPVCAGLLLDLEHRLRQKLCCPFRYQLTVETNQHWCGYAWVRL